MTLLFAVLLSVLCSGMKTSEAGAANVAVVMSSEASAYQEALAGFKEATRHRIASIQVLKQDPATWRDDLKKLRSVTEPDLVFVLGTSALQAAASEISEIPIVHAMVFNPFAVTNRTSKNVTGVSMIPPASQFASLLRELNPRYRRVGTLLDPVRAAPLLQESRSTFEKAGIHLVAREIRSAGEIGDWRPNRTSALINRRDFLRSANRLASAAIN